LSSIERKNYEIISKLCVEYNKSIDNFKIRDKTVPNQDDNSIFLKNKIKKVSSKFVKFIMQLIYNKAICDPDKLNQYEPFSPQVYGETSFDLITEMIKRVPLTENDIFIDLGSGVGNVVLQVAALTNCKLAFGIEKAEWPAKYAKSMEDEFRLVMNWFGKKFSNCQLYNGDFLHDSDPTVNLKEMINEAK
jgi:H3 lysine-79-specific histone-lysine N-methyltransferase